MRPYIAIDIETTGLDIEKCQILQIAAVFDDGHQVDINKLFTFNRYIKYKHFDYFEPQALVMNHKIVDKILNDKMINISIISTVLSAFNNFITECKKVTNLYDEKNNIHIRHGGCTLAGKNIASFDLPILRREISERFPNTELNRFNNLISYRHIDVGSMYAKDFGFIPGLNDINKKIGIKEVTHDALDDARNVVEAIRWKLRNNNQM